MTDEHRDVDILPESPDSGSGGGGVRAGDLDSPAEKQDLSVKEADKIFNEQVKALTQEVQQLSQAPFRQVLAEMLGCKPSIGALRDFADRAPDRWAQAVAIMAKNAGYAERHQHEHNHAILIAQMSDADLWAKLNELEGQMKALDAPVATIEHQTTS